MTFHGIFPTMQKKKCICVYIQGVLSRYLRRYEDNDTTFFYKTYKDKDYKYSYLIKRLYKKKKTSFKCTFKFITKIVKITFCFIIFDNCDDRYVPNTTYSSQYFDVSTFYFHLSHDFSLQENNVLLNPIIVFLNYQKTKK